MLAALEDGGSTDFEGCACGRDDQVDVAVSVVLDLGDAVMQETDTDDTLACTDVLGRAGAGLCVNLNVLVEVDKVLDTFIMSVLLDHRVDNELSRSGCVVVGEPDETFVLGIKKILPILRFLDAHTIEFVPVDHESEDSLVDAIPVTVGITVYVADQMACIFCFVCFQKAFRSCNVIRICRAAEPNVA